jgi:hypothetical protein
MSIANLIHKYADNTAFSNAPTESADTEPSESDIIPTGAEPNADNRLRQAVANFSLDFREKLRLVIAEMEGDLLLLRYRHFDKALLNAYGDIWKYVVKVNKQSAFSDPIGAVHEIISYVGRQKQIIENIEFMAKRHVENTNVDTKMTGRMTHPKLRGLATLLHFVNHIETELKKIEPSTTTQKTWFPPAKAPKDLDKVPSLSIKPPAIR